MTCDRIWRKCFIKHIQIPARWRNDDADMIEPRIQDVFWVECSVKEVIDIVIPLIHDEVHKSLIEEAVFNIHSDTRGLNFIVNRRGNYVQYYPFMTFNDPGSLWEKLNSVKFDSFQLFDRLYPVSSPPTEVKLSSLNRAVRTYKVVPGRSIPECIP